jgi:aarF domain-containing kinase
MTGKRKAVTYAAATTGTLAGSVLFFSDEVKHGYIAAERTGRVVTTLAVCINE